MSRTTSFLSVAAAALLAVTIPAPGGAATYDKLTEMTFSGPVQIPGAMLDAGTYRFRLTNPETSRNVLQVLSHDGSAVYAMFHTIPDSRLQITEEAIVTFKETPEGVPPAVKSLFYGGEHRGYEFVYGAGGPMMIRRDSPQPEITYLPPAVVPAAPPIAEPTPAPLTREWMPAPVAEYTPAPVAELPRTASRLPWVAASGLISLVVGLGAFLLRTNAG